MNTNKLSQCICICISRKKCLEKGMVVLITKRKGYVEE